MAKINNNYTYYILSVARQNQVPLTSTIIDDKQVLTALNDSSAVLSCYGGEPSTYIAYCYFSSNTSYAYVKSHSSFSMAILYGVI